MPYPAARQPAGPAAGAVAGDYPDIALGVPPVMGPALWDEFVRPGDGVTYGDLHWPISQIGVAATVTEVAPSAASEFGIAQLDTTGAANPSEGGAMSYAPANRPFYRSPPVGSIFTAKVALTDLTQIEVWTGFASDGAARVAIAIGTQFIGFRVLAAGSTANWFGVVKDGAGAPNESTQDMDVAADTSFRILGFARTALGVQFFRVVRDERRLYSRINVGAVITTNLPSTTLTPVALGVVSVTGGQARASIDFWGLGGQVIR